MKTFHTRRPVLIGWPLLILLFVGCTDLAFVDPEPEIEPTAVPFTITSALLPASSTPTVNSTHMAGTFEATGSIQDRGTMHVVLDSPEPLNARTSLHGVKTLTGTRGTITIEFYVGLNPTDQHAIHAYGGFEIMKATGVYMGLLGSGEIDRNIAAEASPREITRVLEGEAYYTR